MSSCSSPCFQCLLCLFREFRVVAQGCSIGTQCLQTPDVAQFAYLVFDAPNVTMVVFATLTLTNVVHTLLVHFGLLMDGDRRSKKLLPAFFRQEVKTTLRRLVGIRTPVGKGQFSVAYHQA